MKTSADGIAVMHAFEGCKLAAYPDPATGGKPWTVGWGDTGPDVVRGLVITQQQADERFAARLAREFEPGVLAALKRTPTQNQFDAMVSLAYNIGLKPFADSTLVRRFNAGEVAGAADAFLSWTLAGGKPMLGLKRRRTAERALFQGRRFTEAIDLGRAVR